jgi:hypothetical protein
MPKLTAETVLLKGFSRPPSHLLKMQFGTHISQTRPLAPPYLVVIVKSKLRGFWWALACVYVPLTRVSTCSRAPAAAPPSSISVSSISRKVEKKPLHFLLQSPSRYRQLSAEPSRCDLAPLQVPRIALSNSQITPSRPFQFRPYLAK